MRWNNSMYSITFLKRKKWFDFSNSPKLKSCIVTCFVHPLSFWHMFDVELQWSKCCPTLSAAGDLAPCTHVALSFSFHLGTTHTASLPMPEKGHLSYPSVTCNLRNGCHGILPAKRRPSDTKNNGKFGGENQRRRTNPKTVLLPLMQHLSNGCKIHRTDVWPCNVLIPH